MSDLSEPTQALINALIDSAGNGRLTTVIIRGWGGPLEVQEAYLDGGILCLKTSVTTAMMVLATELIAVGTTGKSF